MPSPFCPRLKFLPALFCALLLCASPAFAAASPEGKADASAVSAKPEAKASTKGAESQNASQGSEKASPSTSHSLLPDAWEVIWSGQREMIQEVRETAIKLSDHFSDQTANLSRNLQPFEEEGRRLLVLMNTFKGRPNSIEALSRRMAETISEMESLLEPVTLARSEAQGLLERVNFLASSLPEDLQENQISAEMRDFVESITRARLRLTAVLAQYDSLMPSLSLLKRLEAARQEISQSLPRLWLKQYSGRPVPYLSPSAWSDFGQKLFYAWQGLLLRLPVEIPGSLAQMGTALLRFGIGLIFSGALVLLMRARWLKDNSGLVSRHIFRTSLTLLCLGFALIGASMGAHGEFFRYFLAVGCIVLIYGQICLAWDLRLLQYPNAPALPAPFLRLMPLALFGILLNYLPLTRALALALWILGLMAALAWRKRWPKDDFGELQLEASSLDCYAIIIWLALLLALSGFGYYSFGLYLGYAAFCLALELTLGGIAIVSNINEHLPQEGARAVLARLLVALAAPMVLVASFLGILAWLAALPGGIYLISEFALKGVSVGATQFNIIQVLLIISAFYITRTVVSMGTRFLGKLPGEGLNFDPTLITPLQTTLTYVSWAVFGLFVLKSLGMELSNLAMVAGGLSVGIGFGMQTIVNNFLSGLILIFSRTLQVGDVVEVGGTTGRVRKISVRATMVETYDNAMIYVPNSEFMSGRLTNWSSFSRKVRRQVNVGVAYGSNTSEVIRILIEVAKAHANVLKYPAPTVIFSEFGASTLDFTLRFWVKDFELGGITSSDIRLGIERTFAEAGIEIAFPQLDVHLKDDSASAQAVDSQRSGLAAQRPGFLHRSKAALPRRSLRAKTRLLSA